MVDTMDDKEEEAKSDKSFGFETKEQPRIPPADTSRVGFDAGALVQLFCFHVFFLFKKKLMFFSSFNKKLTFFSLCKKNLCFFPDVKITYVFFLI